jgi:virulence factor Mce-like protein
MGGRLMNRAPRFNPFHVGLGVMVAMILIISGIVVSGIPGGPNISLPWSNVVTVKATMTTADALAPKASVEIAGVKVGEVQSVDLQGDQAVVTMNIQGQYADIHQDARVQLRPHGLFGPKYIELTPGTQAAPLLHGGDTIPSSQEVLPVDLDQILQELQANEQHQLTTAIVEFGKASAGRGSDFNSLVAAGNTLSQTLASPLTRIDSVSSNLSDMFVQDEAFNSSFAQTPLDKLVEASNVSLRAFADTSAQLGDLLQHADTTLANLDAALSGEAGNIRATLEKAPGVIDQLTQFNDFLGRFSGALGGSDPDVTARSLLLSGDPNNPNDPRNLNLAAAIENPRSALSSYDGNCPADTWSTSKQGNLEFCSLDGHFHYIRVQNLGNNNAPGNAPPSPGAFSIQVGGAATTAGLNSSTANASDLVSFGALIGF